MAEKITALDLPMAELGDATKAYFAKCEEKLGMVPNPYGVYIDVRTGSVIGAQKPVRGSEVPYITYKTNEQIALVLANRAEGEWWSDMEEVFHLD